MRDPFHIELMKFVRKAEKTAKSIETIDRRAVPLGNREQYDRELAQVRQDLLSFKRLLRNFERDVTVEIQKWGN